MRTTRLAVACAAALALSGCWLQPGFGPSHQNFDPDESAITPSTVGNLTRMWSAPLDAGATGEALVTTKAAYTAAAAGADLVLTATDRTTGARLWRRDLAGLTGLPPGRILAVTADDKVLVLRTSEQGSQQLEELDGATGATTRALALGIEVDAGSAVVSGDFLAYRTISLLGPHIVFVHVLSVPDLTDQWSAPLAAADQLLGPMLIDGTGTLFTLDVDPAVAGAYRISGFPIGGCGATTCSPTTMLTPGALATQGARYELLAAIDGGGFMFRETEPNGREAVGFVNPSGVPESAAFDRGTVGGVVVTSDAIEWVAGEAGNPALESPFVAPSPWTATVPGGFVGPPAGAGGLVYAGGSDGDVRAYAGGGCGSGQTTCPALATLDTGPGDGPVVGISVSLGWVYVTLGGSQPRLVAFALPT